MKRSLIKLPVSMILASSMIIAGGAVCLGDEVEVTVTDETEVTENDEDTDNTEEVPQTEVSFEEGPEALYDEIDDESIEEDPDLEEEIIVPEDQIETEDVEDSDVSPAAMELNINNQFPDPVLRKYVKDHIDTDGSGGLSQAELNAVEVLRVPGMGIKDIEGVRFFNNLYFLDCSNNNISSIDLTFVEDLEMLYISGNPLTEIDISSSPELCFSYLYGDKTSLDNGVDFYSMGGLIQIYIDSDVNVTATLPDGVGWVKASGGKWQFKMPDGTYAKNKVLTLKGKAYAFDSNGYMVTSGWFKDNFGKWVYTGSDGVLLKGWQKIKNKWYYFQKSGIPYMQTGYLTIGSDMYYFDKNGVMQTGWVEQSGLWQYFDSNGKMHKGWLESGKNTYYLNPSSGYMITGVVSIDGKTYEFLNSGALRKNCWVEDIVQDGWRYLGNDGQYVKDSWQKINKKWYYFNDVGYMYTGWLTLSGKEYLLGDDGVMQTGWYEIYEDSWLYFGTDGVMKSGWQKIGGKYYYFADDSDDGTGYPYMVTDRWIDDYYIGENGVMATGWYKDGDGWRYFGTDGVLRTGLQVINGKTYYFGGELDGWMETEFTWIDDYLYYFGDDGVMRTGWNEIDDRWYYMGTDGKISMSWTRIGAKWYFFEEDGYSDPGAMVTGWFEDYNGKWYYFETDGHMLANCSKKIGSKTYKFDSNGVCTNP